MEIKSLFDSINSIVDIQGMIDHGIRESETLEYKLATSRFSNKEKNEIPKDVTAMANSSGGIIIYGVSTDRRDKTLPRSKEKIDPINIETFDRVVNTQIASPIKGIQKKVVPANNPESMVVFVPQSDEPPHQCLVDKKYYRRSLGESIPMEHYLIELYFGRRLGPVLSLEVDLVKPVPLDKIEYEENGFSKPLDLRLFIKNSGQRIGRYVLMIATFPSRDHFRIVRGDRLENIDTLYEGQGKQVRQFTDNIGVFHPGMRLRIADMSLCFQKEFVESRAHEPFLSWTIWADNMSPKQGFYLPELLK